MKIKLTPEQIEEVIKQESDKLIAEKKEKLNRLEEEYEIKISQLREKYANYEIDLSAESSAEPISKENKRKRFTEEDVVELRKMAENGQTVKEMADHFDRSEPSIRQKLSIERILLSKIKK